MYAIVEIAGQQFKVNKDQKIFVHRQAGEPGDKLSFDRVYLVDNENDIKVGMPVVDGASVQASVVSHLRGDKVLIFKKKRRKSYQKMNGHRQDFTRLLIEDITV
jgi:large subunit ribosomal protein L21